MAIYIDGKVPYAADVWAAATRTLTDFSAEEIFDLPEIDSHYFDVGPTTSATANTFGGWVELIADVGVGKRLIWVVVALGQEATSPWEIELGEGVGASEDAITRLDGVHAVMSTVGLHGLVIFYPWKSLTDNARLSARVKQSPANARTYRLTVGVA